MILHELSIPERKGFDLMGLLGVNAYPRSTTGFRCESFFL